MQGTHQSHVATRLGVLDMAVLAAALNVIVGVTHCCPVWIRVAGAWASAFKLAQVLPLEHRLPQHHITFSVHAGASVGLRRQKLNDDCMHKHAGPPALALRKYNGTAGAAMATNHMPQHPLGSCMRMLNTQHATRNTNRSLAEV